MSKLSRLQPCRLKPALLSSPNICCCICRLQNSCTPWKACENNAAARNPVSGGAALAPLRGCAPGPPPPPPKPCRGSTSARAGATRPGVFTGAAPRTPPLCDCAAIGAGSHKTVAVYSIQNIIAAGSQHGDPRRTAPRFTPGKTPNAACESLFRALPSASPRQPFPARATCYRKFQGKQEPEGARGDLSDRVDRHD